MGSEMCIRDRYKNALIRAELNKEKTARALTGLVSLFIVLLKLTSRINISKAIPIGIKGIKIEMFMEFSTKEF